MAGIRALRKIQLGLESASAMGTEVDATKIMYWTGTAQDDIKVEFSDDDVGQMQGNDRTWIPSVGGTLDVEGYATYEQLPYILTCGVLSCESGTADGSGYVYTFTYPTTAVTAFSTATLEFGDNTQEEQMTYGFIESFSLSGAGGEALKLSATWRGRQIATGTYTGALTLGAVETILFNKASVYIDDGGAGTIGTTIKSNTLLGITYDVKTGIIPVQTASGQLYFSFAKQVGMPDLEITCKLTFEHDATAVAEIAAWRAQTERLVRVNFPGSALQTPGTIGTKLLRLDMVGKWESFDKLGEQDGNDIVTGTLRCRYGVSEALGKQHLDLQRGGELVITLRVNKSRLTIGDVLKAEAGIKSTSEMVDFLTKFVAGEDGNYLPADQARAALLDLSLEELPGVVNELAEGIKAISGGAVPLPTSAP
jgi:hypothetical protein